MIIRLIVYAYFPLLYVGLGAAKITGDNVWQGLVFIIAGTYVLGRFLVRVSRPYGPFVERKRDTSMVVLYAFVTIYSVLYFLRSKSGLDAVASVPTLLAHLIFWHTASSSKAYENNSGAFVRDIFLSVFIGFLFGFINALAYTGFSFEPGSIHDLSDKSPLVRSDVDVPLLSLGVVAFGLANFRPPFKGPSFKPLLSKTLILLMVGIALFSTWMYSRRGPLLAMLFIVTLSFLSVRNRKKVILSLIVLPLIPLLWELVAGLLIELSQNEYVRALLARNRVEDYLTATGRLGSWIKGFDYMLAFEPSHLIGYGGAPSYFVMGPGHYHMHNMGLDLFFDAGYLGLALGFAVLVIVYTSLFHLFEGASPLGVSIEALFLFYSAWIMLTPIEPMLHSYSVAHMLFLMIAIAVLTMKGSMRRSVRAV